LPLWEELYQGRIISRLDGRLFGCIQTVVKGIVFAPRLHSTTHKFSYSLPLWEELSQGLMDSFLDVSKAL